ncbi:MAG: HD domain-containing protein, partial [Desulfobulbaceae bacterium]|nr:HD domain-containing protein [Desulfobulbaceae bacterium]
NYIDTIYRLTLASEYKDEETGGHIKRISLYTKELALGMGLGNEFADIIFNASPMHDIGKVSIPDAILLKQGHLDNEELKIMQTHPAIGAKILEGSDSPLLKIAADIALCHHERWDGTGYPQGLKGEKTPLEARITILADIYDALRSNRPYKPTFDHQQACGIILEGDGRTMPGYFDPLVLKTFTEIAPVFADIFAQHQ